MESIFHEKQEGYLCAQHCLNALLQGQYFDAVHLSEIASQLDAEERRAMAESGEDTDDYRRFIEQPSGNMDDSGYFSVQVISKALEIYNLELIPYTSHSEEQAERARDDPSQMKAYICNYKGHWFTIRKLGKQWFNLNSMQSGPQLISDTYLTLYLSQLINDGYSIFIVNGNLPACEADEVLRKNPVTVSRSKATSTTSAAPSKPASFSSTGYRLGTRAEDDAKIMEAAAALTSVVVPSTSNSRTRSRPDIEIISENIKRPRERIIPIKIEGHEEIEIKEDDDDDELQRALQLSLQNFEQEERSNPAQSSTAPQCSGMDDAEEDDDLRRALQLSLECVTAPQTPDQEHVRWQRLNYLTRNSSSDSSAKLSNL
ncbi:hypothetical protein TKK_0003092 [Trichogramma kaykai]